MQCHNERSFAPICCQELNRQSHTIICSYFVHFLSLILPERRSAVPSIRNRVRQKISAQVRALELTNHHPWASSSLSWQRSSSLHVTRPCGKAVDTLKLPQMAVIRIKVRTCLFLRPPGREPDPLTNTSAEAECIGDLLCAARA